MTLFKGSDLVCSPNLEVSLLARPTSSSRRKVSNAIFQILETAKRDEDGAVITGQTEATLDVLESGEYTVEIDFSGTCTATDSITIEFTPIPVLNPIDDQFICDDDNDGLWSLDLATLATQILGAQDPTDVTVSFHDSQTAADTNNSPISAPYTNTTAYTQEEIFIRE